MTVYHRFNSVVNDMRYNTSYPLSPSDWQKWRVSEPLSFVKDSSISLYFHIPFCKSLCKFCEYTRFHVPETAAQIRYVNTLLNDLDVFIESNPHIAKLKGLDVGGGTPTALELVPLKKLLVGICGRKGKFTTNDDFMPSIEGTFSTVTEEKIKVIAEYGFKRMSFGIQSISSAFLHEYNRQHGTIANMHRTFEWCRKYGISCINVDIMYGFPNQSDEDIMATVNLVGELAPEHVTVYELRTNMLDGLQPLSRDTTYRQYNKLYEAIMKMGWYGRFGRNTFSKMKVDYGVSSYLKERMVNNGAYKGFGISAQSKSSTGIAYNICKKFSIWDFSHVYDSFREGDIYRLPPCEMLAKYVAISGYCGEIDIGIMSSILEQDAFTLFSDEINFLLTEEYITLENNKIFITPRGFRYYGAILSLFYPSEK